MSMQVEAETRIIIDSILRNKGWILDINDINKNVYCEQGVLDVLDGEIYKRLKNSRKKPDYVLLGDNKKPIAVIEAKAGGKNLDKALEQGMEYAEMLEAPLIFAMNNSYCQTMHLDKKKPLYINEQEVNELIRTKEAIKFITERSNEIYTIDKEILLSRQELITIFKNINDSLRSEGLSAGIERLTEFANILFLKLYTENKEENIWTALKNTSNEFLIDTVNSSLNKIQTKYNTDIFTNIKIKKPDTVREIITRLDKLKLSSINTDIKGDAFEYFLKSSTATSNDLGEYFTPRHTVKAIINLVAPKFNEKIYDPFCGTGGFLTEAFNYIKDNTIIDTEEDKKKLTHETIFGREITNNARLAKMNMILHGDGHNGIEQVDSLENKIENKYDVITTNMPFSQKIVKEVYDPETKKTTKKTLYSHKYQNSLAKNNGDGVCMLHCYEALKKGGRMALIVPEGVLFKKELISVRQFLMEHCKLQTVVSLPQGTFLPYTGVKTDILYFVNCKKQSTDKVWFLDVKNDGFTLDNHRKKIKENDLKKIEYVNFKKQDIEDLENLGFMQVSYEDIKKNDYNLSINRYRKEEEINSEWEMVELGEVCELYRGITYSKDEETTGGNIIVLRANNIDLNTYTLDLSEIKYLKNDIKLQNEKKLYKNDIFICLASGSKQHIGKVAYIETDLNMYFGGFMGAIRINNKIIAKYLYYLLKTEYFNEYLTNQISGSNINNLNNKLLYSYKIPLPPLEIQEKIVKEIEEYEKIINGCREVVENWKPKFEIEEEWEKVELREVVDYEQPTKYIVNDTFYNNNYKTPVLTAGQTFILGYTNETDNIFKEKLPVIIFDDFTTDIKYVNFPFKVKSSAMKILHINNKKANIKYIYNIMQNIKFNHETHKRYWISEYSKIQIPLPPLEEQEEIVAKIEEEEKYIDGCKKMIEIYKEKIKKVIDGVVNGK